MAPANGNPFRLALTAAVWLGLFALLFTFGASLGVWPRLPAGALRDSDLLAGLLFAAFLLWVLLRKKRSLMG